MRNTFRRPTKHKVNSPEYREIWDKSNPCGFSFLNKARKLIIAIILLCISYKHILVTFFISTCLYHFTIIIIFAYALSYKNIHTIWVQCFCLKYSFRLSFSKLCVLWNCIRLCYTFSNLIILKKKKFVQPVLIRFILFKILKTFL